MKKVLIIDAHNMIHRARHGFNFGENSTIFGFFRCLKSEIDRHKPDFVHVVNEGNPRHRKQLFSEYKANRKKEKDVNFKSQLNEIFDILEFLPVFLHRHPDYECDDVISMLCKEMNEENKVIICSSDSDFIQLLEYDNVSLWNPVKKCFIDKWPVDYLTWKSLRGDASDNIPGVRGVGEKTANKLASDSEALNNFFNKKPEARDQFELSKNLIKFADLKSSDNKIELFSYTFDEGRLFDVFSKKAFKSIVGKSWQSWKNTFGDLDDRKLESNERAN